MIWGYFAEMFWSQRLERERERENLEYYKGILLNRAVCVKKKRIEIIDLNSKCEILKLTNRQNTFLLDIH